MAKKRTQSSTDNTLESVKFEDAIEQIEQVIDKIESGQAGLEESLAAYERATKLIGRCRSILDVAQKRITQLTQDADGRLVQSDGEDGQEQEPDDSQTRRRPDVLHKTTDE